MLQLCKACLGVMRIAVHDSLVGKHTGTKKPEAFSQQALHDLTLVGERSPTLILCPKREGLRVQPLALLFSAVLLWAKEWNASWERLGRIPRACKAITPPLQGPRADR